MPLYKIFTMVKKLLCRGLPNKNQRITAKFMNKKIHRVKCGFKKTFSNTTTTAVHYIINITLVNESLLCVSFFCLHFHNLYIHAKFGLHLRMPTIVYIIQIGKTQKLCFSSVHQEIFTYSKQYRYSIGFLKCHGSSK